MDLNTVTALDLKDYATCNATQEELARIGILPEGIGGESVSLVPRASVMALVEAVQAIVLSNP